VVRQGARETGQQVADSHVPIRWLVHGRGIVPQSVGRNEVYLSAVSAWEIAVQAAVL